MNSVGEKLKKIRLEKKLTQKELADILGVTQSAVAHYESGSRGVSDELKIKYAIFFNETVGQIFFDSNISNSNNLKQL